MALSQESKYNSFKKEFKRGNILTSNQYTALKIQWCFYWSLRGPPSKYSTTVLPRLSNAMKSGNCINTKKEEPPPALFLLRVQFITESMHVAVWVLWVVKDIPTVLILWPFSASPNSREIHLSTLLKSQHWRRTNSPPLFTVPELVSWHTEAQSYAETGTWSSGIFLISHKTGIV